MSSTPYRTLTMVMGIILIASGVLAQTPTFFISEYVDGTGDDNAIELFNGTGAPVNMGDYFLRIRFKDQPGVMVTIQFAPNTQLASGETFVLVNENANPALLALADFTSTWIAFDGDDAITLATWNGVTYDTVDSIGQWDIDPGNSWDCIGGTTKLITMRRQFPICAGDPDENDPYSPCLEWDFYPVDSFDDVGSHTAICNGIVPDQMTDWGTLKAMFR